MGESGRERVSLRGSASGGVRVRECERRGVGGRE